SAEVRSDIIDPSTNHRRCVHDATYELTVLSVLNRGFDCLSVTEGSLVKFSWSTVVHPSIIPSKNEQDSHILMESEAMMGVLLRSVLVSKGSQFSRQLPCPSFLSPDADRHHM
ncbi:hypothetical protein IRJ41_024496, partial [Triplophysa rosa]